MLGGCASRPADPDPDADGRFSEEPRSSTLFLKARYGLSPSAPAKDAPDSVTATQFQNAFVNEDLRSFATNESHPHLNITSATLTIFYSVDTPLVAPIVREEDQEASRIVFWLGSRSVYVASASVIAAPVLLPGEIYEARVDFPLPEPGWIVPRNEPIMVLFANLVPGLSPPAPASPASSNLHLLVDGNATPSRLELSGKTAELDLPATLAEQSASFEILGNTALFTGATPEQVPSRIATAFDVSDDASYLEVRVVVQSNAGGKSDLDFTLFGPSGALAATSSTPYQSESVRLFQPNMSHFGPGSYRAEVTAYSGANTRFDLRVLTNEPR